ncbi:hypothetical protein J4408_02960 [Candidatus Pacearchaeota archaeon]|nr:hypothetical protein [Candidatus Pacearchaeota archaeon]
MISKIDFDYFWRLESINNALQMAVVKPVTIIENTKGCFGSVFTSEIYYDAADNEVQARSIMKKRLEIGEEDILIHLKLFGKMRDNFYSIQEFANTQNRNEIYNETKYLCKNLLKYHDLVISHKNKLKEFTFLELPSAQKSKLFLTPFVHSDGRGYLRHLRFNNEDINWDKSVSYFKKSNFNFKTSNCKIPELVPTQDDGEGINYETLRGRLELTIELIRRAKEEF